MRASHGGVCTAPAVPNRNWAGNDHRSVAMTRKKPVSLRTGDDRNAYGIAAGGSQGVSAMERNESVVRAIPTVSILILALDAGAFKGDFVQVQRKSMRRQSAIDSLFARSGEVRWPAGGHLLQQISPTLFRADSPAEPSRLRHSSAGHRSPAVLARHW